MLAAIWSPTWVIDGRDTVRTPHLMRARPWKEDDEHCLGMLAVSPVRHGGAWLFAMPRYRDALAARRSGQCAEPGKPTGDRRLSHGVLGSRKWGELRDSYVE